MKLLDDLPRQSLRAYSFTPSLTMTDALSELSGRPPPDPDAQATITDFIDYTEFFPSDLFRSLTLIGKLDEAYLQHTAQVHDLTKTYGSLPTLSESQRPNAQTLRRDISLALHHALRCRESSFAEAARLSTVADNLTNRIHTIKKKLEALPKPPSRDPTPVPRVRSPVAQRNRNDNDRMPRIRLKGDSVKATIGEQTPRPKKHRSRRIVVPGEVLPPFDPNSPGITDDSDSEVEQRPVTLPRAREKTPRSHKLPKVPKSELVKIPKSSAPRLPGSSGTNVHSAVAGISVSNAMALLEPPPDNPIPGSRHAPWLSLTEWELNKIRKRMKKNADWLPSEIMVKRELHDSGRGMTNYTKAKARAAETGEEFLDEEPDDFKRPVIFRSRTSEPVLDADGEEQFVSKGMKLNEAKKLKRLQEAAEREEANRRITQAGLAVDNLFSPNSMLREEARKSSSKRDRKRGRTSSGAGDVSHGGSAELPAFESVEPRPKKIKLAKPADGGPLTFRSSDAISTDETKPTVSDTIYVEQTGTRSSNRSKRSGTSAVTPSVAKNETTSSSTETNDRVKSDGPASIKLKLNQGAKPSIETVDRRETLRGEKPSTRTSSRAASKKPDVDTATTTPSSADSVAGRRSRRSAVNGSSADTDAATSDLETGKRVASKLAKAAAVDSKHSKGSPTPPLNMPVGKKSANGAGEESYCLCGGPSSGRMIACDDPHCKIEWFHLECVGLNPNGGKSYSRATWYCPDCRGKHGVTGDGIVRT